MSGDLVDLVFFSNDGPHPPQRGDKSDIVKLYWKYLKILSLKLLGQFQPNLEESILRKIECNFLQIKAHTLPQGEIIQNNKNIWRIFKYFLFQNYRAIFNQTWHKASLGRGNSDFFSNKEPRPLQGEIIHVVNL